jgi:Flp pilus assembly protein TadD
VLAFQGDYSEALFHLYVVNRIDPGYRTLLFKLGTVLARLNRCDEATACLRKALARNPAGTCPGRAAPKCRTKETGRLKRRYVG